MPNVYIREWDKTKNISGEYENFTVVVPGFVKNTIYEKAEDVPTGAENYLQKSEDGCVYFFESTSEESKKKAIKVFDENGVATFTKQNDFLTQVGAYEMAKNTERCAPTLNVLDSEKDPTTIQYYTKIMTGRDFYETYKDKCYYISGEFTPAGTEGRLKKNLRASDTATEQTTYTFTKADSDYYEAHSTASYAVILPGNEGTDKVNNSVMQIGNQIAYELLGLGYEVLYKKIAVGKDSTDLQNLIAIIDKTNEFWNCFKDRSLYDFRYICTGILTNGKIETGTTSYDAYDAFNRISEIASYSNSTNEGRGDCAALVDALPLVETRTQAAIVSDIKTYVTNNLKSADKYTAIFANKPTYTFSSIDDYKNRQFPASFDYLACAKYAQENEYSEWYAVAGFTRGISKYKIASTEFMLGEQAQNELSPRVAVADLDKAVNLIIKIRNSYYLYGNRTAHTLDADDLVASHFLNIRQLCITLNKQLYTNCKRYTFEPNSDVLWINFCSDISKLLDKMKADQGISDYKIIKVKNKKKATLSAKLRIVPIEAVEDFYIDIYLENSLEGTVTSVSE